MASLVQSTIGKGRIRSLDASAAEKMPGVLLVLHHGNIENVYRTFPREQDGSMARDARRHLKTTTSTTGASMSPLLWPRRWSRPQAAAAAISVEYDAETPDVRTDLSAGFDGTRESSWKRGDPDQALSSAPVVVDETYVTPVETHNPMEMHGTVAVWDGDNVTLYDEFAGCRESSHGDVGGARRSARKCAHHLALHRLGFRRQAFSLAAIDAGRGGSAPAESPGKAQRRPAHDVHRMSAIVRARSSAFASAPRSDGKLTAIRHDFYSETSLLDDFVEHCGEQTPFLYSCPNLEVTTAMVRRNVGTPAPMRGPGAVPGLFALESAMDELAIKLNMDPLELRLKNDAERDEGRNLPVLLAPLERVLHDGRGKDRLEEAHARSRLYAPRRQDRRPGTWRRIVGGRTSSLYGHG